MFKNKSLNQITGGKKQRLEPLKKTAEEGKKSARTRTNLTDILRPSEQIDRTLSYRHEIKYVISESKAAAIERFVRAYLNMDHYSKLRPHGLYPVASLYLDSPDLRLCQESLRGHKNRFKLRVRTYDNNEVSPCFFEIKRRINTVIMKSRARVKKCHAVPLLTGRYIKPSQYYITDEDTLRQFQLYMYSIVAKPAIHVRYLRKAFEGDSDNRVRITFDHQLSYKVADKPQLHIDGSGWQKHHVGGVVLEIKFTGRYPFWLKQMAEFFCLSQQSMSKYATSVKNACELRFCAPPLPVCLEI